MHARVHGADAVVIEPHAGDHVDGVAVDDERGVGVVLADVLGVGQAADEGDLQVAAVQVELAAPDRRVDVDVGVLHHVERDAAPEARVGVADLDGHVVPLLDERDLLEADQRGLPRRHDVGRVERPLLHLDAIQDVVVGEERDLVDLRADGQRLLRHLEVDALDLLPVVEDVAVLEVEQLVGHVVVADLQVVLDLHGAPGERAGAPQVERVGGCGGEQRGEAADRPSPEQREAARRFGAASGLRRSFGRTHGPSGSSGGPRRASTSSRIFFSSPGL